MDGIDQSITDYPESYTFMNLEADHTINAIFEEIPRYTVTTSAEHGTITENSTAYEHESVTVDFTPEEHYELSSLTIDGETVNLNGDETSYTFTDLTADHTVHAIFTAIPMYTLQIQAEHGTVMETTISLYRGDSYTTRVEPDRFCRLTRCLVDGKEVSLKYVSQNVKLRNIKGDHIITLIYEPVWLYVLIIVLLSLLLFTIILLLLHLRRKKKRRQRAEELRRMRREAREFYRELDEMEEKQSHRTQDRK